MKIKIKTEWTPKTTAEETHDHGQSIGQPEPYIRITSDSLTDEEADEKAKAIIQKWENIADQSGYNIKILSCTIQRKGEEPRKLTETQPEGTKKENANNLTADKKTTLKSRKNTYYKIELNRYKTINDFYLYAEAKTLNELKNILNELVDSITADDLNEINDTFTIKTTIARKDN